MMPRPDPALHQQAMDAAGRILGTRARRRAATMLPLADALALAQCQPALDEIACAAAALLIATAEERAAMLFASPALVAAHDTLAELLAAAGYLTLQHTIMTKEKTDGPSKD